jgi:adenine C2-methylase RlmN of 23S rRNA A2503 and tRNA A37
MENKPPHLLDLTYPQLKELVISFREPAYRTDQVLNWIYQRAPSFDEISFTPILSPEAQGWHYLITLTP